MRQQRHEPEHRPVAQLPHPDARRRPSAPRTRSIAADGGAGVADVSLTPPRTRRPGCRRRSAAPAPRRPDRPRALAGRERRERRADRGVALLRALGAAPPALGVAAGVLRSRRAGRGLLALPALAATLTQLALPLASRPLGAQLARPRSGVGGVGQRAHDRDPLGAGVAAPAPTLAGRDPADREERHRRVRRRVADELEPDGRAARLGRRRVDGPDADVVDVAPPPRRSASGECVERPTSRRRRRSRAPAAPAVSSWPTWTPSAPAASDQVGTVVEDEQRVVARRRRRAKRRAAARISSSEPSLIRSCTMSTPPRSAAARNSSGRSSQTRYRWAVCRRWRLASTPAVWQDRRARIGCNGSPTELG